VILGGRDENWNMLSDVEVLDMQTDDTGCNATDLPSPVSDHATVYSSSLQSLITCGGWGKYYATSRCTFQSKNGNQISLPSMNNNRRDVAMVSIRNLLVSIGGQGFTRTESTMETIRLNTTNDEWSEQFMPFEIYRHCAVTLDDNVIVIGGFGGQRFGDTYPVVGDTWIYNVVKKDWTEGPKLNEKRRSHACLVDEEKRTIHIMGGYDGNELLKSTEKWIFGSDSWISGPSLPEAVRFSAAVNSNSEETIGYLVAGDTYNGATSKVWSLRRRDMKWIEDGSKRLKTPRHGHTVVNIPMDKIPGC